MKVYNPKKNVYVAATERISFLFDSFETINVSVSSGKDSTVLWHLALQEAIRRDRKIHVFFLDQEAEYKSSIDIIKIQMDHPNVIPFWYQVPCYMTNATSYKDYFLYAWGENEKWMREKDEMAIKEIDEEYPKRFYEFFPWYESKNKDAAYLVGLRAEEGIIRYRAVTKFPGWNGIKWGTVTNGAKKFYPIYDWTVYDVWKYIYDFDIKYNKIYDLMYLNNVSIYNRMRVSNLVHEKSYKCISDLPKYEPETYDKLCKRISGISTAARYCTEKLIFSNKKLPKHYNTWKEFRNFLVDNLPDEEQRNIFKTRFLKQKNDERTYKAQVGQLLINDFENSKPIDTKRDEKIKEMKEKWLNLI